MIRTLLWLLGGAILGGIIHLVTILTLPMLAEETAWTRIAALNAENKIVVLDRPMPGEPNPLHLDPELVYGVCQINLAEGPAFISGTLPDAFWSVAVFNDAGVVTYSTTNRDGIGQTLEMGLFNAAQTRLLAQQQIDIVDGLLVVEAATDQLFVVIRLAPPQEVMRDRFADRLSQIACRSRSVG